MDADAVVWNMTRNSIQQRVGLLIGFGRKGQEWGERISSSRMVLVPSIGMKLIPEPGRNVSACRWDSGSSQGVGRGRMSIFGVRVAVVFARRAGESGGPK